MTLTEWRNTMRRTASEIIRSLETRIARLEKQAGINDSKGLKISPQYEKRLIKVIENDRDVRGGDNIKIKPLATFHTDGLDYIYFQAHYYEYYGDDYGLSIKEFIVGNDYKGKLEILQSSQAVGYLEKKFDNLYRELESYYEEDEQNYF